VVERERGAVLNREIQVTCSNRRVQSPDCFERSVVGIIAAGNVDKRVVVGSEGSVIRCLVGFWKRTHSRPSLGLNVVYLVESVNHSQHHNQHHNHTYTVYTLLTSTSARRESSRARPPINHNWLLSSAAA